MEVYIEYAVAENFILDLTLLYLSLKTVRLPVIKRRLVFAAGMGTAFAVIFPVLSLVGWVSFVVRYLFGVLLCLVAVPSKSLKDHILSVLFFYLYTFALGGLILGMYTFFEVKYQSDGSYIVTQAPMFPIIVFTCCFGVFVLKSITALFHRYRLKKLLYRCKITYCGVQAEGVGLLDTGNRLTYRQRPVCLLDERLFAKLIPFDNAERDAFDTMYVHTATGGGELKIFQAYLQIYSEGKENIIDKVYFALAPETLGKGYQIIIQPQLFKEGSRVKRTVKKNTRPLEKNNSE